MRSRFKLAGGAIALIVAATASAEIKPPTAGENGWVSMFDGKTLTGWQASEKPENWKVEDGAIVGRGPRSHLFWTMEQCENCEFRATVKINKGGNSGMYFRAQQIIPDWPKGYEAQVNVSHTDPVKTGSLYNIVKILDKLVQEDTWYTEHIIANGNHIIILVNDKLVVDHIEDKNMYSKGYLAVQQHDPGSVVMYKDVLFRRLPSK
jgi:Domain of Unknown Function (DUF1080)